MNPEIKKLWLAALRSDDYQQHYGSLHVGNKFCVWGVLCDLYTKCNNIKWHQLQESQIFSIHGLTGFPPVDVLHWAGFNKTGEKHFIVSDTLAGAVQLSSKNDKGATFKQLADLIETEW